LLGDPKTIRCSLQTNDAAVSDIVSLADLALQPLDLVFLIGKKVEATGFSDWRAVSGISSRKSTC